MSGTVIGPGLNGICLPGARPLWGSPQGKQVAILRQRPRKAEIGKCLTRS